MILATITLTGYLGTRLLIGRFLFHGFDFVMEKIPGIKYLYSSIKEIMDSFVGDKKDLHALCGCVHAWSQRYGELDL